MDHRRCAPLSFTVKLTRLRLEVGGGLPSLPLVSATFTLSLFIWGRMSQAVTDRKVAPTKQVRR